MVEPACQRIQHHQWHSLYGDGQKGNEDVFGYAAHPGISSDAWLAAESYRSVFPQYYDIALKGKYSVDKDTANMVDLVLAGRNFDFSFLFGDSEFQGLPYMFRDMLRDQVADIASRYAKIKKALNKSVDKIAGY
ncbi:MAG: hypothetical protein IJ497_00465, partial [Clostridia bacterium]|nr:hypothetical protein [Clostridia bacterium]